MSQHPNFLFLMADQIRNTSLDGMADGICTPNLRRLMDQSVLFTRAACTCPLCTPSRASLATGRHPSRCGVPIHDAVLAPEQSTFYQALRDGGYRVGIVGKSDLHKRQNYCGPRGDLPVMYHYGFTDPVETEGKMNSAWYGKNADDSLYPMGPYQKFLLEKDPELMLRLEQDYRSYMRKKPRYYAEPSVLPPDCFLDDFIGEQALNWLQEHDGTGAPWHLTVSFAGPHNPWDPPRPDYEAVGDGPWPDPIPDDMEGKPAWIRQRAAEQTGGMTEADLQQVKRCYAGSIRVIDRWVGKLLDWLEQSGHSQDTVVLFCADHGELLGDHGLLEKSAMYEGCLRIPLMIHTPNMRVRRDSDALAELMDLAPTCLELAGLSWDERQMDARSLVPVLQGADTPLRPVQRSELHNCTMLFDGRYKWIRSYNDTDELYDLENDPQELHNVIGEHPEVIERFKPYSFRH